MIKLRSWMFGSVVFLVMTIVTSVRAQDIWDDESLFAREEMTLDEAVTGTLPEAQGGDDLFDSLFGGNGSGLDDLTFDAPLPEAEATAAIDAAEAFAPVDADTAYPDEVDGLAGSGASDIDDLFGDVGDTNSFDASTVLDEMVTAGDQDQAVAEVMDTAGLGDLFSGELDGGALPAASTMPDDFGDLFGSAPSDEPAPVAPAPVAEDDAFGDLFGSAPSDEPAPVAPAPVAEDDAFGDLFGVADPEKGVAAVEPSDPAPAAPDSDVDFDALFTELATLGEPEDAAAPDRVQPPAPVVDPVPAVPAADLVTSPALPPATTPPAAEPAYKDSMALDDAFFTRLVEESRSANDPPPVRVPSVETTAVAPVPDADADTLGVIPPPAVAEPVVPAPEGLGAFEEAERLRRIARENHAINSIDRADTALAERDYRRAIMMYEESMRFLPRRADLEPVRARVRKNLAEANFQNAMSHVEMKTLDQALTAAQSAARLGHFQGPELVWRIQQLIDTPPPPDPVVPPPPRWGQEDFLKTESEIQDWLKKGREAYLTGEYERAILDFESVLARDPENKEAIRMIRAAADRRYDRSSMEMETTRTRMMGDVRASWNSRRYGLHEAPIEADEGMRTDRRIDDIQREEVLAKLTNIRIPELSFRQSNIRDVISFLQQQSVEFDPAPNRADRTGVNIILQLDAGRGRGAAGAAPAPVQDFFAPAPDAGVDSGDDILITFNALDMTLLQALETVVEIANLQYRIRGNVVMVLPQNAPVDSLQHRMYDVMPSAINRLQELSSSVAPRAAAPGGGGDFLSLDRTPQAGGGEQDLRPIFLELGVQWPTGSSIKSIRGLGKIVVANTPENLAVFEKVLSILNVVPQQIEIEARFIEVAQTDVESLGLEWMLTDNWQIAEMGADASLPPAARRRIVMNSNQGTGGFTGGNRFLDQTGTMGPLGGTIQDRIARVGSVLTNPELSVVLHALEQRGHTDLLSAPKITTQSGQSALIKVVTEYIYPTEFRVEGIDGGGGGGGGGAAVAGGTVGAVVEPSGFQTREVGVILEVLPEVSPEGQMIDLRLTPRVVSEPTWRNYGSTYTSFDMNGNPIEQVLNMEQPFFHSREIETRLLIYNGATVVMGGMITEVRNSVDDKIPLLGDIPVLGRLFRSKYDSSEKRNLLIFVTARLVDPAGRPLETTHRSSLDQTIVDRMIQTEN